MFRHKRLPFLPITNEEAMIDRTLTSTRLLLLFALIGVMVIGCQKNAALKVCKVAGEGVSEGSQYSYKTTNSKNADVIAGPAPGGYCQIFDDKYQSGFEVGLKEVGTSGTYVKSITVEPPTNEITRDLTNKEVVLRLSPGVTEVTFVNTTRPHGYLEICKEGGYGDVFEFLLSDPDATKVQVMGDSCSPAIFLPVGPLTVTEAEQAGYSFLGCEGFPLDRLTSCQVPARTAVIEIVEGEISTQSILTLKNKAH